MLLSYVGILVYVILLKWLVIKFWYLSFVVVVDNSKDKIYEKK